MKKLFSLSIMFFLSGCILQAQTKIVGEKGRETIVGEKRTEGVVGEKGREEAIATANAEIEVAYATYNQQREEMEKSLAVLHLQIEEGIRLLEKYKRFKSPKQGIVLRNSWRDALKLQEGGKKKINVVKHSVVAPDMIH